MKKRIGSKLYDTERGIPVLPEQNLYKQPSKKTFYLFDGETITPISYEEAYNMVRGAGKEDLLSMFEYKATKKGYSALNIEAEYVKKVADYARAHNMSMVQVLHNLIDALEA